MRRTRVRRTTAAAVFITVIAMMSPSLGSTVRGPERPADQGLQGAGELEAATRAVNGLFANPDPDHDGLRDVQMVATVHGDDYWVIADLDPATVCAPTLFDESTFGGCDAVRFTRSEEGTGYIYDVGFSVGENPLGDQSPQARAALSTIPEEFLKARATDPPGCTPTTDENCRPLDVDGVTYPEAYERLSALFDSPKAPDLVVLQPPGGPDGSKGGHGHLSLLQSRATLLTAGRGARRAPLGETDELNLRIQNTDIAPTISRALGLAPYGAGATGLNGLDDPSALLRRQDGRSLDELLAPTFNTFVVVIDGLEPELVTPDLTPNLWNLSHGGARATTFAGAKARMITETNANHTAMLTGRSPEEDGLVANNFYNRISKQKEAMERPGFIQTKTLFDAIETQKPYLRTAAVLGKEKLRLLFDCTRNSSGACGTNTDNPEGQSVSHVQPDYLLGSSTHPDQVIADPDSHAPGEPASGSGVTLDQFVMKQVIQLQQKEDPDFTFVNLGQVDAFQHLFGSHSAQGLAAVRNADLQIGLLVESLRAAGKWEHSILIATADHSFLSLDATGSAVESKSGSVRVSNPVGGQVTGHRVPLDQLSDASVEAIVSHSGSASVYLKDPNDVAAAAAFAARALALLDSTGGRSVEAAYCRKPSGGCDPIPANWELNTPRIGEVLLTADDQHVFLASRTDSAAALTGQHGGIAAAPVPLIVASGGSYVRNRIVTDTVTTGSIAPTVAWIYGITGTDGTTPFPGSSWSRSLDEKAFFKNPFQAQTDGDIAEPLAKRALLVTFDANNSTDVHCLLSQYDGQEAMDNFCGATSALFSPSRTPVPTLRWLRDRGTLARYGSIVSFPTVTFPNHLVLGTGVHPGHHDLVGNRFYDRANERIESPIDPADPRNPVYFWTERLTSTKVETLHEATHRSRGDWMGPDNIDPLNAWGAYTAAVDEPTVRGADFASLEPDRKLNGEPLFAGHVGRPDELLADTNQECLQAAPEQYGQGSAIDHLGQSQARMLFEDPSHPLPTLTYLNFSLVDEGAHTFGPHTPCALASYHDSDARLARVLAAMADAGVLGETLIIIAGDHSQENQRQMVGGGGFGKAFDAILSDPALRVGYVAADNFLYLRTMDVTSTELVEGQNEVTFTVTDNDTGLPVGGATVEVRNQTGDLLASETTPPADGERHQTVSMPRRVSDAGNDAQDLATDGRPIGDLPTVRNPNYAPSSGTVTLEFAATGPVKVTVTASTFSARTLQLEPS
ncbi:MAG: alkaline phosphatase family protein [Actinomycetota bacterium]